ncbi:hypothetical protein NDN08_003450 [Rhodosorus marinus]|uniref:ABC transmembrane type-1 domain-containing protein n=1 Tax=Rhodosorus marinus TaxID=101924 RepID=A0AAV8V0T3_9RHOD|nr:hypothetical protein NDN08_003450 [Rhodosorus marinus]
MVRGAGFVVPPGFRSDRGSRFAVCGRPSQRSVWMVRVQTTAADAEESSPKKGHDPEDEEIFVFEQEEENLDSLIVLEAPKVFRPPGSFRADLVTELSVSDLVLLCSLVAVVYGLATASVSVMSGPYVAAVVSTDISKLPWYTLLSTTRIFLGYLVSLVFAIVYAYCAYRIPFAAKALVLIIDILQSIPLLSFLPGVVLGLMALFPGQRAGVELAAMLLLFTSMAWNMVLGFYQSLCTIPRELLEASQVFGLSSWKRFWTLELPAGAMGLVWNSIVSVAGGWFFLISIESFELGNQDFRLPGIGAFLASAAEHANYAAISWGLLSLVAVIVVADFVVWRPLVAWSSKFSYGSGTAAQMAPKSSVLNFLQRSQVTRALHDKLLSQMWLGFVELFPSSRKTRYITPSTSEKRVQSAALIRSAVFALLSVSFAATIGYAGYKAVGVLSVLPLRVWLGLGVDALYTLGRVLVALVLSILWTVPLGVAVGRDPALASRLQPLVQIFASVPATALFPFVLLALVRLGNGLQIGSIVLMMLGMMWYILFNVIAGAQAIPPELFEVDSIYGKESVVKRWKTLILPGIFPYLITGIVTAVGGAWNASIVSEYVIFQGNTISTRGLGSAISVAASTGDYSVLLAGTLVMCGLVLLTNRFVWGPLYKLANTKYRLSQS